MRKNKFNVGDVVYYAMFDTLVQAKITKCKLNNSGIFTKSKEEMNKDLKWIYELNDGEKYGTTITEDNLFSTFEDVIKYYEKAEEKTIKSYKEASFSSFLKGE